VAPPISNLTGTASLLSRTTRRDLSRSFIIVDAAQLKGIRAAPLADYVAMATLAQLDPAADTSGYPSILNLFRLRDAGKTLPTGMTEWDLAYLRGLYSSEREAATVGRQESDIARAMQKALKR
jgi:hypothetical protein